MPWRALLPLIFLALSVFPDEAARADATPAPPPVELRLAPPAALGLAPAAYLPRAADPKAKVDPDADWRWPKRWILFRFLRDLYQIPEEVPTWDGEDVGRFALFASITGLLMLPPYPADVALHDFVVSRTGGKRTLWTPLGDALIWTAIWAAMGSTYLAGWLGDRPPLMEAFSLSLEAFAVAQIYQTVPKLLIGREGPSDGSGRGIIRGPAWGYRLWPAGTPSGHAASLYAMIGVMSTYFDDPPLAIALQVFGLLFCASMVADDYHFLSDIVWGASMGYYVGVWVVHHRSTRFAPKGTAAPPPKGFFVMPTIDPAGGRYGLSVAFDF